MKIFHFCIGILLLFSINSQLTNKVEICKEIKATSYALAEYYKDVQSDHDKRDELYDQSNRPYVYELLKKVRIDENPIPGISELTDSIQELFKSLDFRTNDTTYNLQMTVQNFKRQKSSAELRFDTVEDEYVKSLESKNRNIQQMEEHKKKVEENAAVREDLNTALEAEMLIMKIKNNIGLTVLENFETFKEVVALYQKLNENIVPVKFARQNKEEIEILKGHLDIVVDGFKILDRDDMEEERGMVNEFMAHVNALEADYNNKVSTIIQFLEKLKEDKGKLVRENPDYAEYLKLTLETLQLVKDVATYKQESFYLSEEIQRYNWILKMLEGKRRRLTPEDALQINENYEKIGKVQSYLSTDVDVNGIVRSETVDLIRKIHTKFKDDWKDKFDRYNEANVLIKKNFDEINTKEKQVDTLLGQVFALLQNPTHHSMQVCMSNQEFSIILYFWSLTNMIVSKKEFLNSFFNYLNVQSRVPIAKQIYMLSLKREYVEAYKFPPDTPELTEEHQIQLGYDYSQMINYDFMELFKVQLEDRKNPNIIRSFLYRVGFRTEDFVDVLREIGFEYFFSDLVKAILAVIGLAAGMSIIMAVIVVIICWLTTKLIGALMEIYKDPTDFNNKKAIVIETLTGIYRSAFKNDVKSLNYAELISSELKQSAPEMNDFYRYPAGSFTERLFTIYDSIYQGDSLSLNLKYSASGKFLRRSLMVL